MSLNKGAMCTDIHFGKKSNSETHNQDCIRYLEWFRDQVKADPSIDHVLFLGDWHESRSALNLSTLNYSYQGAQILNSLGIPVYFIVGNHDLYHRHTRDVHSLPFHSELNNIILVEQPTLFPEIGDGGAFISPYLFEEEYDAIRKKYNKIKTWFGHFEFKGFIVTGYNVKMPTGPESKDFKGPKRIFSGHFHKRQQEANIIYIGNTFPMDFGDAGDNERGMAVYQHDTDELSFIDWPECPKYLQISLSDALEDNIKICPNTRVKCIVDVVLDYEQTVELKSKMEEQFDLREFKFEETAELASLLTTDVDTVDLSEHQLASVNELVVALINTITSERINKDKLVKIYRSLNVDFKSVEE